MKSNKNMWFEEIDLKTPRYNTTEMQESLSSYPAMITSTYLISIKLFYYRKYYALKPKFF